MVKENIYQPFEIFFQELDDAPVSGHSHNFFELVYIIDGTGKQCINKNKFDYSKGHFFLLTPKDHHSFEIEKTTKFFYLRFGDIYLKSKAQKDPSYFEAWTSRLEFIFENASNLPGCILKNIEDRILVKNIVDSLIKEYINRDVYHQEVINQLVNTVIVLVARSISRTFPLKLQEKGSSEAMLSMVRYVQSNIYKPEMLKSEQIATHFNLSQSYVGEYFKKHTGENLQQYITNYKLQLVETRLRYSDLRINEIAFELGFTDESHLNRIFKKYKGTTPSDFRKKVANLL